MISVRHCFMALSLLIVVSLSGCSTQTFAPTPMHNPLHAPLPEGIGSSVNVSVLGELNSGDFQGAVYIKLNNFSSIPTAIFSNHVYTAVENMGVFQKITATQTPLRINTESREAGWIDKTLWYESRDPLTMVQLKAMFPDQNMLVLEATLREDTPGGSGGIWQIGKKFSFDINLTELKTGRTLFYAQTYSRNWMGLHRSILNPVLNQVSAWLSRSGPRPFA